nr:lysosomal beta glucosidase-like [Ipomoea batatas]
MAAEKYKDPKGERIKDLMKRMTLEEKIGQMTQIERKRGALSTRLGIPIIYGIDAVHGNNNVYKATIFPHNVGLGVTRDPELVKRIGAATALEVRATGVNYAFAPCIAVCRDPRWGRCYESYSEDHKIVQMMTEIIPGLQGDPPANSQGVPFVAADKTKVVGCAKHFVGDGGTVNGTDESNTIIDINGLLSIHMPAYYDSIRKGVATVMGFVISDWEGIDRITDPPHANYTYSVQAGVLAGIDMVMVPINYTDFIGDLTSLVKKKVIPMSRINDAVKRILRVKFMMGLFENPMADMSLASQLGSQEHRELAREAVRKSLVLLKNGKSDDSQPLMPLPKKAAKILVAGTHAHNLGYQCGGWTIEWQGAGGNDLTIGTTILTAVKNTIDPSTQVIYQENPGPDILNSNNFSYAIVVVGETPYTEMFGDSANLTILEPGGAIINNVCAAVKCAVVVISGWPVALEQYISKIDALIAAWLPGSEGQGVADALFGDYGFTGKLARTWFKSVDQLPMNVGDPHYDPLFPFGFGMTTEAEKGEITQISIESRGYSTI